MSRIVIFAFFILFCLNISAQIVYHDAGNFPILGKVSEATETRYERLPAYLKKISRSPVWNLGKNTAGLALRFRTNSTMVAARWTALSNNAMNHQTATGTKGLDLYALVENEWVFVNSGRPTGQETTATIIGNMTSEEREYMLYLPLYDGVSKLEIGVDSLAFIGQPQVDLPRRTKPVVCYGTSILQGGCATRPGMAHTNILERRFNREFINLGFSGNALLDLEIAELMATVDASLFILDFLPNANVEQMNERAIRFFRIIREKHPDTPVLFVEDPVFTHSRFDNRIAEEVKNKNATINRIVNQLKAEGEKNIELLSSRDMLGRDGEATVDGVHFTDLGFMRYADLLTPYIEAVIR
ncbi:hydrolase [Bacteroidia bacterium]|nr:hydrolase [Bacteroidia bacterium]